MKHRFGGLWTREKLRILEKYLAFYTTALKNKGFTLHYVDALAGTGKRNLKINSMQNAFFPEEDFDGSVRIALEVQPGFDQYHFNDLNPLHIAAIKQIKAEYPNKNILTTERDANIFVPEFCASLSRSDRAVLFLDPFSTELNWTTLEHVANPEKIDLWLLFPISVILRMTPTDGERIRPEWDATLTRLLGTDEWRNAIYKAKNRPPIEDMFGRDENNSHERLNTEELELWVTQRLKELFSYVAKPIALYNNNRPLFLFYFAVSNPKEKAWRLADRVVQYICKSPF